MKFNLMAKQMTTYFTELNDKPIQFNPIDNVTLIQVLDHIYTLPYGLKQYKQLNKQQNKNVKEVSDLLEKTIKPINVSRYGHDTKIVLSELAKFNQPSEPQVLALTLANELKEKNEVMLDHLEYKQLIDKIIELGDIYLSNDDLTYFYNLGKTYSPEIHNEIVPTTLELIKQLDKQGILDDFDDIAAMMKAYVNNKKG